jgi:hypothetical protein
MLADRRRDRRWRHDDLDEMVDATGVSDPVPDPCPPAHFAEMRAACSAPEGRPTILLHAETAIITHRPSPRRHSGVTLWN